MGRPTSPAVPGQKRLVVGGEVNAGGPTEAFGPSPLGLSQADGLVSEQDADADLPDPLLGRVIDNRYRVLQKLGEGGMGAVYQVEHVHMGKYMAMKLLLREFSGNKELVRRFRREAQAISRLNHIHTVQVFDFGRSADGAMYMVMEYIQGETLADLLARVGPLSPKRVARIVGQICASLAEAHGLGIVHRDLKPENVMMVRSKDERDFVKVLDFGLAKLRERGDRDEGATSHGSLVGTPYYMSPEQIRGGDIDARADIYSLGAMLFKMLTGEPPFKAASPIAVLTRHLQDPPPSLRGARPELEGSELEAVVQRAMAKDAGQRYAGVDELRLAIEDSAVASLSPSASLPRVSTVVSFDDGPIEDTWAADRADFDRFERGLRARRGWAFLAFFLVLAGGAGTVVWGYLQGGWFERHSESEPNNQRSQANNIQLGRVIKGHIGKRLSEGIGDVDWFRIKPPEGPPSVLRAEVTGVPNIDLVVEAYVKDQKVAAVVQNENGMGGGEIIPNLHFDAPAFIVVREAPGQKTPTENSSDAYTLTVTARPLRPNEEREPNDDLDTANEMPIGTTIFGSHGRKGDRDYFRFPRVGKEGEVYDVRFNPSTGTPATLEAITANLRLRDKLPGRVTLPGKDTSFYIVVSSPQGSSADLPYTLQVMRVP